MTKIVIIGAGSAIFGLNTLGSLLRSPKLRGSQIALVDLNAQNLERMTRLADKINQVWDAGMQITSHLHHQEALSGADFVVSAVEVPPREKLWRQDFEIPLKYGVRQPYAENGGPGGFAHTARNINPILEIAGDMQQACPNAWYINFTNPMVRICDAINRYTSIKVVGLCHQIYAGYGMVGYVLADELGINVPDAPFSTHADPKYSPLVHYIAQQTVEKVDIKAAGLNHFTWIVDIRSRLTGEDLYPDLHKAWKRVNPAVEPLTRQVYEAFGLMPVPGDEHLDEYLPWCSDPQTTPWEKFDLSLYDWEGAAQQREEGHQRIDRLVTGEEDIDTLKDTTSEGAVEVIEALSLSFNEYHLAVNLPNIGQINNLPLNAIVETPALLSGMGVQPVAVGNLPEGIAELLRREITVSQLSVDAAVLGDRQLALQALLLDPVITDLNIAKQILEDYLLTYREYLPQFWN
ncbi:MAG: alpha-glucosidase/alpha-galactosidase [Anaerolineales bacterium]|nr:alpha-glucosidase/alpha-galactosidase [Anaerolineales bacterium]